MVLVRCALANVLAPKMASSKAAEVVELPT